MRNHHREELRATLNFQLAIRFYRWGQSRAKQLQASDFREVMTYWGVAKATAYRYIRAYNDALGNQ